jgi:hypothetical protein
MAESPDSHFLTNDGQDFKGETATTSLHNLRTGHIPNLHRTLFPLPNS